MAHFPVDSSLVRVPCTAALFWWLVVSPGRGEFTPALAPWAAMLYFFAAMSAGSVLGIVLALQDLAHFPIYEQLPDPTACAQHRAANWGRPQSATSSAVAR